jgi:hypothetical protein
MLGGKGGLMPRKLNEGEWVENRGRSEKYPYDEWFAAMPCVLLSGEDFKCKAEGLKVSIHTAAKKRGIKVETAVLSDGVGLRKAE